MIKPKPKSECEYTKTGPMSLTCQHKEHRCINTVVSGMDKVIAELRKLGRLVEGK